MIERFFKLKKHHTTISTEIIAGLTTFFTMAYILVVNPQILSLTGMPKESVFIATILASVVGTLIMGFIANVPYAQAPGMGLNAFFTYVVCFSMGFQWQEALAMVFVCGIITIIITVTSLRKKIIHSIPSCLQNAVGGGIGIFIAYVGIKNAGLLKFTAENNSFVTNPDGSIIADSSIIPGLVLFNSPEVILSLIAIFIMLALVILKVKGSIFIGMLLTTLIGIAMGVVNISDVHWFSPQNISSIRHTSFALFGDPGFVSLMTPGRILAVILTVFAFSLSDTFDTIGTFIGTGRMSGIFDQQDEHALLHGKGFKSKLEKALFADATATTMGAMIGTSNVTTYIESSAGISVGGKTGLTSVVVAILFLLCLPFGGILFLIPPQATAAAMIIVGIMMMSSLIHIKWDDFSQAASAFFIVVMMAFAYNISYGLAFGFSIYCFIKIITKKFREIHPILGVVTILFVLNFILQAL